MGKDGGGRGGKRVTDNRFSLCVFMYNTGCFSFHINPKSHSPTYVSMLA